MTVPPDFSKIKAVFFDAGGTLFRPFPSVGEIYAEVAGRHGLQADPEKLEEVFHLAWEERDGLASLSNHSNKKKEREWWHSLVREVFSPFGFVWSHTTYLQSGRFRRFGKVLFTGVASSISLLVRGDFVHLWV